MDVRMPDGTIIKNVPEGTTQDDLTAQFNAYKFNSSPAKEKPKMNPMVESGSKVLRSLVMGGPMMAAATGVGEGMNKANEFAEKSAYDAGGWVTDKTGSPEAGWAANWATQAIPAVAGAVSGKLTSPVLQSAAKGLMQSALKPSKAEHLSGKGARAVQTMLDEGANVSAGGVAKLRGTADTINAEIAEIIKDSSKTVSKNAVASRLQEVVKKYEDSVDPDDLKAVEAVWTKFLSHPKLAGQDEIPIQVAQKMKQSSYTKLGDAAYGQGLKPASDRDSWKGIARGLKEEISSAEPRVAPLNARDSDVINAMKIAQNRVAMDANKNPVGMGGVLSQPWMLPVWMWDRSPLGKSMMARLLNSGSGNIGTAVGGGVGGLYGSDQGMLYP
jgi:hypothetical protein